MPAVTRADRRIPTPGPATLEQLQSLNRLFLHDFRRRLKEKKPVPGLPAMAATVMAQADDEALDAAASFPRALFNLELHEGGSTDPLPLQAAVADRAEQSLKLVLVHSAWNICLQNEYGARVMLGLPPATIACLRSTSLHELPQTALHCSIDAFDFGGADWLWCSILTATGRQVRERLGLVALQPGCETPRHRLSVIAGQLSA